MADFLLSPFKAIYNWDIYIKATKQSFGKTFLFLVYLLVLSSFLFIVGLAIKLPPLTPFFHEITNQVAQVIPEIEIKDGRLSANNGQYYEIAPEQLGQKIVFDTARTEPVYPTQMMQEGIFALITDKAIYLARDGQVQTYNFDFDKEENVFLNGQYILDHEKDIIKGIKQLLFLAVLFTMPMVMIFLMFILMVLAIAATAISQLFVKAEVSFGDVCSICCYLIAPAIFLIFITMLMPFSIPFVWLICFVMFMIYAQFILNKIKFQQNDKE